MHGCQILRLLILFISKGSDFNFSASEQYVSTIVQIFVRILLQLYSRIAFYNPVFLIFKILYEHYVYLHLCEILICILCSMSGNDIHIFPIFIPVWYGRYSNWFPGGCLLRICCFHPPSPHLPLWRLTTPTSSSSSTRVVHPFLYSL